MKKFFLVLAVGMFFFGNITFAQVGAASDTQQQKGAVSGSIPVENTVTPSQGSGQGIIPSEGELSKRLADGTVQLNDIPGLALYWIDWLPRLGALISVFMLVFAGVRFIASGLTEDKEGAKNTMKYAIGGIIVTSLAWIIVNILQVFLTS